MTADRVILLVTDCTLIIVRDRLLIDCQPGVIVVTDQIALVGQLEDIVKAELDESFAVIVVHIQLQIRDK